MPSSRLLLLAILLLAGAPASAQRAPAPVAEASIGLLVLLKAPDAEALRVGFQNDAPGRAGLTRRGAAEAGAVVLTGVLHLVTSEIGARRAFIPAAALGWGGYVALRARAEPGFLGDLGLTRRNLGPAFRDATLAAVGSAAAMAAIGAAQGSLHLNAHAVPLAAMYPAWGLVQQTLVQGMVARNLSEAEGLLGSPYVVVPVTAALFGMVHLPNVRLAAGTTALGLVFTPLYLKHRNLWPLGLYHGVLGVLFYFWVLDKDPWTYLEH